MRIDLDHAMVFARDRRAAAERLATILGVPWSESGVGPYTVCGVPFVAFGFDARGFDDAGPLTLPATVLNFPTWARLPHLVLWSRARRGPRD